MNKQHCIKQFQKEVTQHQKIYHSPEFQMAGQLDVSILKTYYHSVKNIYSAATEWPGGMESIPRDRSLDISLLTQKLYSRIDRYVFTNLYSLRNEPCTNSGHGSCRLDDSVRMIDSFIGSLGFVFPIDIKYNMLCLLNHFIKAETMSEVFDEMQFISRKQCMPRLRNVPPEAYTMLQEEMLSLTENDNFPFISEYIATLADAIRWELQAEMFLTLAYYGEEPNVYDWEGVFPIFKEIYPFQSKAQIALDPNKDVIMSSPAQHYKLTDAFSDILRHGFQQNDNYKVTYLKGLHIAIAENGFHHLSVASARREIGISATNVIDIESHFNDLQCDDGKTLLYKGEPITVFPDTRLAMLFILEKHQSHLSRK